MTQDNQPVNPSSQLFTVRVWLETLGNGQTELRSQVCHVLSGEVRYFREWIDLITYISEQMTTDNETSTG